MPIRRATILLMSNYLDALNEEQKRAVLHHTGPAMVLAGAGSGKTKVLTTRAAHLVEKHGVKSNEILLVTFTNKAAGEMRDRVEKLTGQHLPHVGTFHSLGAKILRREATHLELDNQFTIYDADEQLSLIKSIYKKHNLNIKEHKPRSIKNTISNLKNELMSPSQYQEIAYGTYQQQAAKIYKLYEKALRKAQALDFDDLLTRVVELFNKHPQVLEKYQKQFVHVLVDEYQDTNKVQYNLSKRLSQPHNNIFIVGDFSQSIYAWRGADYKNLTHFKTDFDSINEFRLEQNYRSTQTILDAATNLISQNTTHPILELWTNNPQSSICQLLANKDQNDEAKTVIRKIQELKSEFEYRDIAILYRTNAQSRAFEEACLGYGIPYKVVGGFKFYERKEIKDVLAFLKFACNPMDTVSETRVLKLGKKRHATCMTFQKNISNDPELLNNPSELLEKLIKITKYKDKYDEKDSDDLSRLENIAELINTASQFENSSQFLENISLVQDDYMADIATNDPTNTITLMSLHSAKGLEFSVVFMVGMEEGLLPHSRSLFDKDQLEEERRLCYVGITRAKEKLFFSYAKRRFSYLGNSQNTLSRFIGDIPANLLKGSEVQQIQKTTDFADEDLDKILKGEIDLDLFLD
ncbi:MAG: UvrD-helicase domain-containing protein [Patescibacteria group bacterium]